MLETLSYALLLPGLVSGLLLTLIHWLESDRSGWTGKTGLPVALGVGYLVAHWSVFGPPAWPPIEAGQWLTLAVLVAAAWGWLSSGRAVAVWLRWSVVGGLSLGLALALLLPMVRYEWSTVQSLGMVAALAGILSGSWLFWHRQAGQSSGVGLLFFLAGLAGATALGLLLSGSASMGLIAGGFAFSLGAAWVFSLIAPAFRPQPSAAGVLAVALVGLWTIGLAYTDMTWYVALLLASAPLIWPLIANCAWSHYHSSAARAINRLTVPGRLPSGRSKAGPGKNQPA